MNFIKRLLGMAQKNTYQIYTYRTKDGVAYFKFSYHFIDDGYEIDIHQQPSYENRSSGCHTIHRLLSSRDAPYQICINRSSRPKTLKSAQEFSMAFAEYTWEYIKTGVSIDTQISLQTTNRNQSP
ncbi:hypothetical protein [Algibacter sp. R77976]|uniref:hypothetical protein n=1 Tax=Algibacter sp. R77976 TaxID=3093873 RepID=UPI0037CB2180